MRRTNAFTMTDGLSPSLGDAFPPIVRALTRPEAYPHDATHIHVYETHISWVILAGPFAYKLKKHVNFGFLDFSSLEQRAEDCVQEVALNRRLCPDVYLGVTNIVARDETYFVGGTGHVVEPAVWMRRLPETGMLPYLIAHDAADARLMGRIARRLARFHATAATGPGVDEWGKLAAVRANWEENFAQTVPFLGRTLPSADHAAIAAYVERFMHEHVSLFAERVAAGRVRDVHGDLHSASICVEGRHLYLYDCLEFSPRYRCGDVAAEVAFLAMDLAHYGRADLAAAFVDTYVRVSGDRQLVALLPFFIAYRAYVRGKVGSLRLTEPGLSVVEQETLTDDVRRYFDLAWSGTGGIAHPILLMTMGLPATGKTTLARDLAQRFGLVHLSSDRTRKELAGAQPSAHRGEGFQRGIYNPAMTRRTYTTMHRRAGRFLRRGQSVVLDATYGDPAMRARVRRLARRVGVPLWVFVCEVPESVVMTRLTARASDPGAISDARIELWPALRAAYVEPTEIADRVHLDMTQAPPAVIEAVRLALDVGGGREVDTGDR